MAELYQVTPQNIAQHLKALFDEGELDEARTCKDYLQVQTEGGREVERHLKHYNLDAIIAVGYRVRSTRGTQFRRWATARLREYLVKGFVLDNEREVLSDAGQSSRKRAQEHAEAEYEKFAARRRALAESEGERDLQTLADLAAQEWHKG